MHTVRHILAITLFLTSLAACGPGGDVNPQETHFLIYNYNPKQGDYQLERVPIRTLRNVRNVDGDLVYLLGGGTLESTTTAPETREDWKDALKVANAATPTVEYTIDADGTVVPWDFDSAMMLTVYHHIERAAAYFDTIPLESTDLTTPISEQVGRIPVYYYPQVGVLGIPLPLFTDNAAYAFTMNAFLVPPRYQLTDAVPIYANRGVITHEYGHAVFNRLVHDGERVPDHIIFEKDWIKPIPTMELLQKLQTEGLKSPEDAETLKQANVEACALSKASAGMTACNYIVINELRGLDEGIADIFAFLDVGDPNFIAPSIMMDIGRDMRENRLYDDAVYAALAYTKEGDPHRLGAIVASIFYDLYTGINLPDAEIATLVVKTLRDIRGPMPTFGVHDFFNAFHANLPSEHQDFACGLFRERLPRLSDELTCSP